MDKGTGMGSGRGRDRVRGGKGYGGRDRGTQWLGVRGGKG